jgi:hypothetical protein
MSVKWHNMKVVLRYCEGIDQPILTPSWPMVFDLASDPGEQYNIMDTKLDMGWMVGVALKFVADYQKSGTPRACVGGCGPEQAWLGWAIRSSAGSGLRWRTRTRRPLGFGAAKPTEALGSDTCAPPPHSTRCWPFPVPMWPGGVHPGRDRGRAAPPSAAAALPVRLVHPRGLDRSTRRWRHLDLGAARLYLQAEIRRLACRRCGRVRTETVAWARPAARFTRDFEDVVADLAQRTDKTTSPGCCAAPGRRSPRSWCGWSLPT